PACPTRALRVATHRRCDAPYEKFSLPETTRPSIDPTLMIRDGLSGLAATRNRGNNACVRANTDVTLSPRTLSNPEAGNSSTGAPQIAPALLTSTSTRSKVRVTNSVRSAIPSAVLRSAGCATTSPTPDSSAAATRTHRLYGTR